MMPQSKVGHKQNVDISKPPALLSAVDISMIVVSTPTAAFCSTTI
jgi:hypothetical protein